MVDAANERGEHNHRPLAPDERALLPEVHEAMAKQLKEKQPSSVVSSIYASGYYTYTNTLLVR